MSAEHRFIRALNCQAVDHPPVWIMRQAGRYLPEYRETRKKAGDFLTLCKTPDLACEVTLQPLARFPLDAAIIFTDILTIPDAMGLGLAFVEGEGPRFQNPLRTPADIQALPHVDPETELRYVMDAIRLTKRALNNKVPLIGFAGSPWTLASYMIEGQSPGDFLNIKGFMYNDPKSLHQLLKHLADDIYRYLHAQVLAGADVIMLFDTWGGVLTPAQYADFSLHYMKDIIHKLRNVLKPREIPIILFTKNCGAYLPMLANSAASAIGLDWTVDLQQARKVLGPHIALQGNLDPAALFANDDKLVAAVEKLLTEFGSQSGHIFNLGHGIRPDVDPEKVSVVIEAVHNFSRRKI